ncbi:hypothetical protein RFI_25433 [Reticulomyxa filosa]|uniref:Uncharacterized protein n=1 Tax=Reticulomyxa filosa TaxID=46433 RepID=X6MD62_RETFI|nr:hypothetical protein RFI_25433 [Reticulomyxa filosa]|eukprot:ETO11943.1 hypothetical protein RFI_25433 [Reticulomyxa filosa]
MLFASTHCVDFVIIFKKKNQDKYFIDATVEMKAVCNFAYSIFGQAITSDPSTNASGTEQKQSMKVSSKKIVKPVVNIKSGTSSISFGSKKALKKKKRDYLIKSTESQKTSLRENCREQGIMGIAAKARGKPKVQLRKHQKKKKRAIITPSQFQLNRIMEIRNLLQSKLQTSPSNVVEKRGNKTSVITIESIINLFYHCGSIGRIHVLGVIIVALQKYVEVVDAMKKGNCNPNDSEMQMLLDEIWHLLNNLFPHMDNDNTYALLKDHGLICSYGQIMECDACLKMH